MSSGTQNLLHIEDLYKIASPGSHPRFSDLGMECDLGFEIVLSFPSASTVQQSLGTAKLDAYSMNWSGSVQFNHSVMSNSLEPHEPQHDRSPCPSPTPGVHPNPCPLSRWCHTTISSSVVPFSCPQSFPASGSFQMSQLFASGGQSIIWAKVAQYLTPWTMQPMEFSRPEYWSG